MKEWNPFADIHEHVTCTSNRIVDSLMKIIINQLNEK